MKSYMLTGIICCALGVILGVKVYKLIHPAKPCPQVEEAKTHVEEKTIIRYVDKAGQPVVKETIVTKTDEKRSKPAPERRPNMIGIQSITDGKGAPRVGVKYGRELFPNMYLEGGILVNTRGSPTPAVTAGISILF